MVAVAKVPSRMSVAEFLAWHPGGRWQLVDGEPVAMAPASSTHSAILGETIALIGNHLFAQGSPCRVLPGVGIVPHVQSSQNVRVPDLAVSCTPPTADSGVTEDPVLIVEVLSPSNHAETWANVWATTSIPSVQEILVLRVAEIRADLLRRLPDGTWPREPQALVGGEVALESIGLRLSLAAFYRTTHLVR